MSADAAVFLFIFLAAAVVAVFAFLSVFVWVSAPSRERLARDRYALLKTLAEQPGENAARVLEAFREDEQERAARKHHDDRRGWIVGGLIVMAVGGGLSTMLAFIGLRGEWSAGLIPLLIGCVLFGAGFFNPRRAGQARKRS